MEAYVNLGLLGPLVSFESKVNELESRMSDSLSELLEEEEGSAMSPMTTWSASLRISARLNEALATAASLVA